MTSRVGLACDRVLEAGLLLCLASGVIFFNTHSARGFEPDKVLMLRSFMLLLAAAFLIRLAEGGLERLRGRPHPITLAVLGVALAGTVACVCGIDPLLSWQGSYLRADGLSTTALYLGFFALLSFVIRTRTQLERFISCALVPLPAVCAYALLQRAGYDPLWGDITVTRVGSTAGNAVALGAYLITALPLLAYRTWTVRTRGRLTVGLHLGLLVWATAVMIWTAARGPTIGLLGAGLLVGWVAMRRTRGPSLGVLDAGQGLGLVAIGLVVGTAGWYGVLRVVGVTGPYASFTAVLGAGGTIFTGLVAGLLSGRAPAWFRLALLWLAGLTLIGAGLLNVPPDRTREALPSPLVQTLEGWRTIPWVWRFSRLLDPGKSTGKVRVLLWQGALRQLQEGALVEYPAGETDALRSLRWLVGWGQESQALTFPQFYSPELAVLESAEQRVDRLHNQTLDLLVTGGLLGLVAWHTLFLVGLLTAVRLLGFEPGWRCVGGWVAGALGAGLFFVSLGSLLWLGVALPVCGLVGFALALPTRAAPVNPWQAGLGYVGLAVLAGHLIELQVGFSLVPSTLHLFLTLALLRVTGSLADEPERPSVEWWAGPVVGLVVCLLSLALLSPVIYLTRITEASQVPSVSNLLGNFLWASNQHRAFNNPAGALLLAVAWLGGCLAAMQGQPLRAPGWLRGVTALTAFLPACLAVPAAAWYLRQAYFWLWLSQGEVTPDEIAGQLAAAFGGLLAVYWFTAGACWAWLAVALPRPVERVPAAWLVWPATRVLVPLAVCLAALLIFTWGFKPAVADSLYAQAHNTQKSQAEQAKAAVGWLLPVATLEYVVRLMPSVDTYRSFLGDFLARQASFSDEPAQAHHLRTQARLQMLRARELAPLEYNNATNLALANLHLVNTLPPADPRRPQLQAEARSEYARALKLNPNDPPLRIEVANRLLDELKDSEGAEQLYRAAIQLNPRAAMAFYGLSAVYERRARALPEDDPRRRAWLTAAAASALAGTRAEPVGTGGRDQRYGIMLKLHEAAGLPAPAPR